MMIEKNIAELPDNNDDITKPEKLKQWKSLGTVVNQVILEENISVALVIKANWKSLEPIQTTPFLLCRHYAFRARFSWCVVGPLSVKRNSSMLCKKLDMRQVDANQVGEHFFQ